VAFVTWSTIAAASHRLCMVWFGGCPDAPGRGDLCLLELFAQLLQVVATYGGLDMRPHHILFAGDVFAPARDVFLQRGVVARLTRRTVRQPLSQLSALPFLFDRAGRECSPSSSALRSGGPEMLLFDGLVWRLGDVRLVAMVCWLRISAPVPVGAVEHLQRAKRALAVNI